MKIYKITCEKNKKVYVGQSSRCQQRFNDHRRLLRQDKHTNRYLQNAWNKFGKDNFKFSVLEECSSLDELNEKEKYWIEKLDCIAPKGFNMTKGGKNYESGEEMRKAFRKIHSDLTGKNVYKYDLKGKYLTSYPSINQAAEENDLSVANISKSCHGDKNYRRVGEYQWSFEKQKNIGEVKKKKTHEKRPWFNKKVQQLNRKGNIINTFSSITEAADFIGTTKANIGHVVNGRNKTACGYKWRVIKDEH